MFFIIHNFRNTLIFTRTLFNLHFYQNINKINMLAAICFMGKCVLLIFSALNTLSGKNVGHWGSEMTHLIKHTFAGSIVVGPTQILPKKLTT